MIQPADHKYSCWDKNTLILLGLGLFFIIVAVLNKFFAHPNLILSRHQATLPLVDTIVFLFSLGFICLGLFLKRLSKIPPQTFIFITLLVFIVLASIAVITPPTRSQDLYWNLLLAKGVSTYHLNPYSVAPNAFPADPLATLILDWFSLPMIYGPLWVLVLAGITAIFHSIPLMIISTKLLMLIALGLSGLALWKIMLIHNFSPAKRNIILILLAWNPFIWQNALIDAHNDTFILLSIIASYYFLLKKNYNLSIIVLIIGGFIKFITWPLIIIPLWQLWQAQKNKPKVLINIALLFLLFVLLGVMLYLPFGSPWDNLQNLNREAQIRAAWVNCLLPAAILYHYLEPAQLRLIGLFLFLTTLIILVIRKKPLLAYVLPFIVFFIFGTPWFESWYLLWILPLLALISRPWLLIILTIFSLVIVEVMNVLFASIFLLIFVPALWLLYRVTLKITNKNYQTLP
ncbi:MAG: hypothetical protein WC480_01670 [Patescibacteria group bacterium]